MTKYRYKVLQGEVAERIQELVRETYDAFVIRTVKGVVSKDRVHTLVNCPPSMARSEIMKRVRGKQQQNCSRSIRRSKRGTEVGIFGREDIFE